MNRLGTTCLALLLCCGLATAQESALREKIKKQMEEISGLMRESERLLLAITRIDRLVKAQEDIARKLKELDPPREQADAAATAKQRNDLENKQQDIQRKLQELFSGQQQSAEKAAEQLQKLLLTLPRKMQHQQQRRNKPDKKRREQRNLSERKEKKQNNPNKPRNPKDKFKPRGADKRKKQAAENAAVSRIEAWMATLPPEDLERLNRGDYSMIPQRYRRLIGEYTARRAKRESKPKPKER